ncbi:Alpha/beta hydrolase family-domain-containing protein [Nemania serpens]|nr:Alpha/beta hydrolase family-domain-containing protein [Nemania serpens]
MSSSFPFHIKEHVVPGQHIREWPRATANSQDDVLSLHVKQYIPKDNPTPQPGDVTIIAAHANGFPKELYEPLWEELHARSQSQSESPGFRLRGIWIADVANGGYSGELNEAKLGNDPFWHDHSRDLLHLTNVFRAEMPRPLVGIGHSYGANILTQLALLHPRLLTSLVLFDPTIVDFDPARAAGPGTSPARASAVRRDVWPSREVAIASFARSPFYRSWDPRVLERWNQHALRDLPTLVYPELPASSAPPSDPSSSTTSTTAKPASPGVTLRTTKHQEVFTFLRPLYPHITTHPPTSSSTSSSTSPSSSPSSSSPTTTTTPTDTQTYSISRSGAPDYNPSLASQPLSPHSISHGSFAFYRSEGSTPLASLPSVRPGVLFVHGGASDISQPEMRARRLATCGVGPGGSGGAPAGRVAEVLLERRGHLFPMEIPAEAAAHAARFIAAETALWRRDQADYERWTRLPARQKATLSPEFLRRLGPPEPRRSPRTKKTPEHKL